MRSDLETLQAFYAAFQRRDGAAMAACYAPNVHFEDPIFTLDGPRAGVLWQMLCAGGKDLVVEVSGLSADGALGRAHWEARYTFPATGREVRNVIDAELRFEGGLIVEHRDTFDFGRWARQAFGPLVGVPGLAVALRALVRWRAAKDLDRFVARANRPAPPPPDRSFP